MTNTYYLGNLPNDINLQVSIGAQGEIYTEADNEPPGGGSKEIADSSANTNGTLPLSSIGKSNTLNGCKIEIGSIIDLSDLPPSVWSAVFDNLSASYIFSGGTHGDVVFGCDDDDKRKSQDGSIITISKTIQLTT